MRDGPGGVSPESERKFIAAYRRLGNDPVRIQAETSIHPTVQRAMMRTKRIVALLEEPHTVAPAEEPTELELLSELLVLARKANRTGEYASSIRAYEAYGRRKFGWRNETPTQIDVSVNVEVVRERLIALMVGKVVQ